MAKIPWFYSTTGGTNPRTVIMVQNNYQVKYHGQVYGDKYLVASGYYHRHNNTNFLKYFNFNERAELMNPGWFKGKIGYVYKKDGFAYTEDLQPYGRSYGRLWSSCCWPEFTFPNSHHLQNLWSLKIT